MLKKNATVHVFLEGHQNLTKSHSWFDFYLENHKLVNFVWLSLKTWSLIILLGSGEVERNLKDILLKKKFQFIMA